MELEDVQWWYDFKKRYNGTKLDGSDFNILCELHSKYFNHSFYKPCSCNGGKVIKQWAKELDDFFKIYE